MKDAMKEHLSDKAGWVVVVGALVALAMLTRIELVIVVAAWDIGNKLVKAIKK